MKEGRLGYNHENDRYGILEMDLWIHDGLHCGDCFEVMIDGQYVPTSIEMSWEKGKGTWYLTGTEYRGTDLEYLKVRME